MEQRENNMPQAGKEMNFFDLCVACGRAVGRGCTALWQVCTRMLRLTYRYWWIVLSCVVLAAAAALYLTRQDNLIYRVNAIALLNGASVQQFEQAYTPLRSDKTLPADAAITPYVKKHTAMAFTTYRVIDCLKDGVADYVDYKRKIRHTDTVHVQMQDRLALQFRIKARHLDQVPAIEQALLEWLNADEAMQQSYLSYLPNLREEAVFNHTQAHKLDSLTSHYYFRGHLGKDSFGQMREGTVVMSDWGGDWRVRLFLDEIYKQQHHLQMVDYRLQLASAPVVLENHFAVSPYPDNGRLKMLVLFLLLGWAAGCAIAELTDKRKALNEWLKA